MMTVNATGDVFLGLYGANTTAYKGVWSAQIAASIDAPYFYYHNSTNPFLYLVDSDSSNALLVTGNLTNESPNSTTYQQWVEAVPPLTIFASKQDGNTLNGIQNSYCALEQAATIGPILAARDLNSVQKSIITRNGQPQQQFYINGLSSGSSYIIALAMYGNSTNAGDGVVGGGGQVWPMTNFTTLAGMSFYPLVVLG
jgi:calcium channel MID1